MHAPRNLGRGTRASEILERDRDVEAPLELGRHLHDLQGIEAEVGDHIVFGRRIDWTPADIFQDVHDRFLHRRESRHVGTSIIG